MENLMVNPPEPTLECMVTIPLSEYRALVEDKTLSGYLLDEACRREQDLINSIDKLEVELKEVRRDMDLYKYLWERGVQVAEGGEGDV